MVLDIASFFGIKKKVERRPLLNEIPITSTLGATANISSRLNQKQQFMKWFKTRPELNSPIQIRVDDTITEVEFFKTDGTQLGRNKRMEAEKFWNTNQLTERFKSMQYDRLATGSGFLWIGRLDDEIVKEILSKSMSQFYFKGIDMKELAVGVFKEIKATMDEDLRKPRKIDYLASTTVQIHHDIHDIISYVQWFSGVSVEFTPDEIVHIPLIRIDGKVDGYTPVSSLTHELILLWAIKENMLAQFRNGGVPSKMFVLPEELSNSENHKWLTQQLMDRGVIENRHGNLVLTGKVEVQDLEPKMKDMDYKELALYVTSNVAYALRVPVTRIPYLIGTAATGTDAGGMAESGYWSMIESDQKTIEMHLNQQIFSKLGFIVKFKKRYKIDDLREAQAQNMRVDSVTKMRTELMNNELGLTKTKLLELLDLNANDVEEREMEEFEESGIENRSNLSMGQMKNPDKVEMDATKRRAAQNNPKGSNQTGI